jgi:hypothetical protein
MATITIAATNTVTAAEKITKTATTKSKSSSSRIITPDIETKIDSLTAGALPYFNSVFKRLALVNRQKAEILCEFITAEYNERNVKFSTRLVHIKIISSFDRYLNYKDFLQITKHDIMQYLSTLRKTESEDPTHKWIGTYNTRQMVLNKFFK